MANFQIALEGKLLTAKTTENIKKSLNQISNDVNKNAKFQLIATLNSNNTKEVIQKQLNQIVPKLKLSIDAKYLEKTLSGTGKLTQTSGSKTPKVKQTNVNVEKLTKQADSLNYKFNKIRNNINNSDFHISDNFSNQIDNMLKHLQKFQNIANSDLKPIFNLRLVDKNLKVNSFDEFKALDFDKLNDVNDIIKGFKAANGNIENEDEFWKATNQSLKDYITNNEMASLSAENFYASQLKNCNGILGAKQAIDTYNIAQKRSSDEAKVLASAVGQNNIQLGNFLTGLDGGKAKLIDYAKSLIGTKLRTIGLEAATLGLNIALTEGISFLISTGLSALSSWINKQKELAENANKSAEEIEASSKTIDEYKERISTLKNSLDSEDLSYSESKSKREELMEIQDEIINKYDLEKKSVDLLNDSLQTTIATLDGVKKSEASKWLSDNNEAVEDAISGIDKTGQDVASKLSSTISNLKTSKNKNFTSELEKTFADYPNLLSKYTALLNKNETLEDANEKFVDTLQDYYNWLTGENDAGTFLPNIIDSLGNKIFGGINGRYDESFENYKKAGQYIALTQYEDLYNRVTQAVEDYNEAVSEGNTNKQKSLLDSFSTGIFNDIYGLDLTGEEGAVKYYFKDLLSHIFNEYNTTQEEIKNRQRDFTSAFISSFNEIDALQMKLKYSDGSSVAPYFFGGIDNNHELFKKGLNGVIALNFVPKLSMEELETAIEIVQGKIDTGIDWFTLDNDEFVNLVKQWSDKTPEIEIDITASKYSLKEFVDETLPDVLSQIDKYNSAINSLSDGESISRDTMLELLEIDSNLASSFTSTADGYTIDISKIKSAKEALIKTNKDLIQTDIDSVKASLNKANQQIKVSEEKAKTAQENYDRAVKERYASSVIDKYYQNLHEANNELKNNKDNAKELEDVLAQWTIYSSSFEKDVTKSADSIGKNTDLMNSYLKLQQNKIEKITDKLEAEKEAQENILDNLKAQKEELEKQKETLEEIIADYETAGSVVDSFLEDKINSLTEEQERLQKSYDDERNDVESKYNKEISALQSKNDEINKSIELKKAEDALYNAKNTEVRYYSGNGWRRGTDASAIAEKQQDVDSIKRDIQISNLEKERDNALQAIDSRKDNDNRLNSIDAEIQKYSDYKEAFADMVQSYTNNQNDLTAQRILGADWHERVLNADTGLIQTYGTNYNNYQKQLNVDIANEIADKEKAIQEQEKVISSKQTEIDSWADYSDQLSTWTEEISGTNEDYLNDLRAVGISEQEILDGRVDTFAEFKKRMSELAKLPVDASNEQIDNAANNKSNNNKNKITAGGYSGATPPKQTTSAKKYRLYYVKKNNTEVTIAVGSLQSMRENKQDRIDEYINDESKLKDLFGYNSNGNAPASAKRQFLNQKIRIVPYAKGGVNSVTGLAWLDGTPQKSETIFNADSSKKLFNLVSGSKDLSQYVADNINNNINEMIRINGVGESLGNAIHNEFIFTGNIQANNYAEFENCMNTYLTKVQQDIWTGRR